MLVAHLADLHLGYRAYHRMVQGGINARERDVALAFRAALDRLIELRPALVLVAGDVFHSVRPSNAAIADAFRQFARLRAALPATPVVLIAGNHDSPRSVETGSILRLFAEIPGIHVMDQEARAVHFEGLGATVTGVPHTHLATHAQVPDPDAGASLNVLVLHGLPIAPIAEARLSFTSEYGGAEFDPDTLQVERWDYIALGHHHEVTRLEANMWYAGGIERTSANIWKEVKPKGFLTFDSETRAVQFHELETRPVFDLARFTARIERNGSSADPLYHDAQTLDAMIRQRVEGVPGGIEGKIVRLVIHDLPRDQFRELDHRVLREYRTSALHFHLDVRRPETHRSGLVEGVGRRRTLEQEVDWFIQEHWRPTSSDIDKTQLLDLAQRYLAESRPLAPRNEPDEPPALLLAE